jgi:heptosyltransferase II
MISPSCSSMKQKRSTKIRPVKRIVVKGTNWIGDVFLSLPAVYALRRIYPDAIIDIVLKKPLGGLLSGVSAIDSIIEYDDTPSGEMALVRRLRKSHYDLGVIFPRSLHAALLFFLGGVSRRVGYAADGRSLLLTDRVDRSKAIRKIHQSNYYRNLVAVLGDPGPVVIPRIEPTAPDSRWADDFLHNRGYKDGPLIGINPGAAYGDAKRWFPERFAAAADRLVKRYGGSIVIFGGPNDKAVQDEVAARMEIPAILAAGETNVGTLVALISRCSVFITNDSGPMHIAAALGVPIAAVFGSTNPVTTGPMGDAVIIRHEIDCSNCLERRCPKDHRCMESVTVDEVANAATGILKRTGA